MSPPGSRARVAKIGSVGAIRALIAATPGGQLCQFLGRVGLPQGGEVSSLPFRGQLVVPLHVQLWTARSLWSLVRNWK